MEYKLCKDNGNMIRCDFDCRKCANLVYDAMIDENKRLKAELKKFEDKCAELEKENDYLDRECESLLARFSERIAELEKENLLLKRSCNVATIEKKLQELTEDIIRLDKCLSRRPCVKMEREEED